MKTRSTLLLLVTAFVGSFGLFGWLAFSTLNALKVNGPYYQRLVLGKDLVADVLPPPEYILEEFLVVHQLADPVYRSYLAGLEQRHETLLRDFEDRHKFWAENLPDTNLAEKEIRQALLVDAYEPARRFFKLLQDEFLPLVRRSDYVTATQLLNGPLQKDYDEHRVAINQVVTLTNTRNQLIEAEADKVITARLAILGALGVAIVVGLTLALVRLLQSAIATALREAAAKATPAGPASEATGAPAGRSPSGNRQIESLADLVNNLTNQVHILTFNAATEATRASEQARGFSAVAAEIRQSGAESRNLAESIQALVDSLQDDAPAAARKPRRTPAPPGPASVPPAETNDAPALV